MKGGGLIISHAGLSILAGLVFQGVKLKDNIRGMNRAKKCFEGGNIR